MAQSSDPIPFNQDHDLEDSTVADNTCPECGTDSIISYIDRYSGYEYCTNCDWSDEEVPESETRELIGRRDRGRMEG